MALILSPPQTQFIDGDGEPYAGGTVETYVPGTTTAKATYQDSAGTILNQNPVVLDAAGRAIILGDGDYRIIVRDVTGQLVYDGWTTSIVSAAMQPVVAAPTIADAVALLGISGMIQAETNRAEAAEATLTTNLNAEITRAEGIEGGLRTDLNNEIARATAAESHLQSEITALGSGFLPAGYSMRFGNSLSDGSGNFNATFSPAFPNDCDVVTATSTRGHTWVGIPTKSAGGFTGTTSSPDFGGSWYGGPCAVYWMAIGH